MLVAGEIMNPNLLISSLIKCMFLKDLKVVFGYCIICIPVDPFDPKRFPLIFVICTPIYL